MSETKNKNKRRLSIITLTLFANKFSDQTLSKRKAPKIFEEPSGVVGLGIVAAMHDGGLPNLGNRASVLALPLPSHGSSTGRKTPSSEEMEMSEEYTCVISHVGKNLVKKKEYFDGDFLGVTEGVSEKFIFGTSVGGDVASGDWISSDLVDHYSFGGAQSFLNSCFLCNKQLHGLDIFMYRGETAFCSAECRYTQIFVDENEKCSSRMMTKHTHSFQCFSRVTSA